MKLKELTILLHEGLANRMRVIASLYQLTTKGVKIKIIWLLNNELNCNFEKIFNPIKDITIINTQTNPKLYNSKQSNPIKRTIAKLYNKIQGFDYVIKGGFNNKDSYDKEFIYNIFENFENVFLETCAIIYDNSQYDIFNPTEEIKKRTINNNLKTKSYIGIHIRRGDNIKSQINSGIIPFLNKTKEILQNNPERNFFLATDSKDVKDIFKYEFGESIIIPESDYSRNSENGIKDALYEMLMLANSQKIFGSYWSSFDEVASKLNNTPIEKIINK